MITIEHGDETIRIPESNEEAKALVQEHREQLSRLSPELIDKLMNHEEGFTLRIGNTDYVIKVHYNPNGRETSLEQFVRIVLS